MYRRRYNRYSRYRRYPRSTRRYTRRRYPTRRFKKSVYNQPFLSKRLGTIYNTHQTVQTSEILNNGEGFAAAFRLDNVQDYQDYTNLYNEYKIRAVSVKFIPLANISNLAESTYSQLLYTAIDINGASSSVSESQIRQYQTVRYTPYNRIHKRYFFPRTRLSATSGAGTISGKQPWLSTTQYTTNYHSLLVVPPTIPGIDATEPIYKVEVMYYLSFRSTI